MKSVHDSIRKGVANEKSAQRSLKVKSWTFVSRNYLKWLKGQLEEAERKTGDNCYDVWFSLKLAGPHYHKDSGKPNGIFLEYVVLTPPGAVETMPVMGRTKEKQAQGGNTDTRTHLGWTASTT